MRARPGRYIRIRSDDGCHVFAVSPRARLPGLRLIRRPMSALRLGGARTFVQLVLTRLGCVVTEIASRTPLGVVDVVGVAFGR